MKELVDIPVVQSCPECKNNERCKKYRIDEDSAFGYSFTCEASDQETNNSFSKMWELVYKTNKVEKEDEQ